MSVIQIQKRDNTKQNFDETKIYNAVLKAFKEVNQVDLKNVEAVTDYVVQVLESFPDKIDIETIQNVVVTSLMHLGHYKVAEKYILYRDKKSKERQQKQKILDTQFLDPVSKQLNINQLLTLKERYLICKVIPAKTKDEKPIRIAKEQPSAMFERVAKTLAIGDLIHDLQAPTLHADRHTIPLGEQYNEEEQGNKFYEMNWQLFNKYNLNAHHASRLLYLIKQIGSFKVRLLDYIEINNDAYELGATKELADHFEIYFGDSQGKWKTYYDRMVNGEFMFNTPVLMNFGRHLGGGNACFVLGLKDNLHNITDTICTRGAQIYKKAGGLGINFSYVRPAGDVVGDIENGASGITSWIKMVDDTTIAIKAGTGRRGANMGVLEYWHPEIETFINAKKTPKVWENLNVSVGTDEKFWNAVYNKEKFDLINPRDKSKWGELDARTFFNNIAESAHASGEPGLLFFDNTNKFNPFKELYGNLNCTNPCGEQYLYPNDSCTLGSVNVGKFINEQGFFEKDRFIQACKELTRGLDNVVSLSKYPDDQIEQTTKSFRRIGIGIMGVADALYKMRIGYNTEEGYDTMAMMAATMHIAALEESIDLAMERGQAPNWKKLVTATGKTSTQLVGEKVEGAISLSPEYRVRLDSIGIRNCWVGTEAPTGTIAMISGCSSGIEPLFGLYYRKVLDDQKTEFLYWNEHFIQALKEEGIYSEDLLTKIVENGSVCDGIDEIPEWIKTVFVTAMNIHWADHIYAQSVWQKYVDNSISKTINMPKNASIEDVKQAYFLAHELHCKGLSIYRNESRQTQILHLKNKEIDPIPSQIVTEVIIQKFQHIKEFLPTFFNKEWNETMEGLHKLADAADNASLVFNVDRTNPNHPLISGTLNNKEMICHCGTIKVFAEGCSYCPNCGSSACSR